MLKEKSPKQCLICKNLFITNDVGIWEGVGSGLGDSLF